MRSKGDVRNVVVYPITGVKQERYRKGLGLWISVNGRGTGMSGKEGG